MPAFLPLLAASALAPPVAPVTLGRKFRAGEKAAYRVTARLTVERMVPELETRLPSDVEIEYKFDWEVRQLKADGIAVLRYRRPSYITTQAAEYGQGELKDVEKSKEVTDLSVSPLNEIIEYKTVVPAKSLRRGPMTAVAQGLPGGFDTELRRLALFVGSFDSALDFNPKFDFEPVKPGATWKKTVGYQPKVLAGKGEEQAVQRLDMTYVYNGAVTVNKKPFRKVTATVAFDSDLAPFFNQAMGVKKEDSGLLKIPMKLDGTIVFLLDPVTNKTMSAEAESKGFYEVFAKEQPDRPLFGERQTGRTVMRPIAIPTAPKKKR